MVQFEVSVRACVCNENHCRYHVNFVAMSQFLLFILSNRTISEEFYLKF